MHRFLSPSLLLLPLLLLAPGCADEPPAVARVQVANSEVELPHRRFVSLDLSWRLEEPLTAKEGRMYVFVHLLDQPGSVVRTFDYAWLGAWQPGSSVEQRVILHQSALGPPLAPGIYTLTLGLYDGGGQRWPLITTGEMVDRWEYRVADVRVPEDLSSDPMFQFSAEWLESEPGRDRQVLARRWLIGPGRFRSTGLDGPGELWLRLLLPAASTGQELVLSEAATQQAVVVRSACGDVEVQLAGTGSHDVVLPITPGADDDSCAVEIEPNFYLLELESAERRAVALDGLAWSANPS